LCYAWDTGGVPLDGAERARIMVCSKAQEKEIWKKVGKKFAQRSDVFINERMEDERRKQEEFRQRQSDRGRASAEARSNQRSNAGSTGVKPRPVDARYQPEGNSSSSSSSASTETAKNAVSVPPAPARPIISGPSNPRDWGKIHSNHVTGFCDWVCLPEFLFEEFRAKSPGSDYVKGWALKVRETWEGQTIGEDGLKFWRARWSESHRTASIKKPFSVADALAERDKERAERKGGAA
jgi:uncharacterized protein YdaU (DUF1376 family)